MLLVLSNEDATGAYSTPGLLVKQQIDGLAILQEANLVTLT